ncbi:hypothetical protein [Roseibium salinum]|uniref:Uncharacterized protein n=1 Tax=Roseibium salinum TaxID=1604349 RepID=A0ABT3R441_9HYPH|nr:hypothetical protein [Roseibium sp. DSM 29163]MCX2723833.1 hypothetical protein [Roseibium sp. DSM 29163]
MQKPSKPPVATTLAAFHELAARRGDGLHPRFLEALAKTGAASGPPAPSQQSNENIVRLEFVSKSRSGAKKQASSV